MELGHHTLKAYDQQLSQLLDLILDMGGHVRELVLACKRSLRERSPELAASAKAMDQKINALELKLEDAATVTLALQNPLAIDLRFVTSALKISGILERAGDLAKNTVKRSVQLGEHEADAAIAELEKMADHVVLMLDAALDSVSTRNAAKAISVWKHDDAVDDIYRGVFKNTLADMQRNPQTIPAATHLLFMAKNLERLADYVTNLAKTVHYVVTGKAPDKSLIRDKQD